MYVSGEAGQAAPRVVTLFCPARNPISLAHGLQCLCANKRQGGGSAASGGCKEAFG
jgi:hypothetical protein